MHTDDEIRNALSSAKLDGLVDRVLAATTVEVRIRATRSASLAIGQSRIGGVPDLPHGTAWPRHRWARGETETWPEWSRTELAEAIAKGVVIEEREMVALALPFVAQLDLAELAPHQQVLPRRGHLWLFAEQGTTLGEIAGYPYCASAGLYEEDAELGLTTAPPVPDTLPAFALEFTTARTLPDAANLDLRGDDWYRYTDATKAFLQPAPRHACLVRSEHGSIAPVPMDGYTGILRVDSDYTGAECDTLNWGDAAWITFAIPDAALAAERFAEMRAFRWCG